MLKLNTQQIISKINDEQPFSAKTEDGSFSVIIQDYVPFIGAAIHAGSQLRSSLEGEILLASKERWYEEDPLTDLFISALPMQLIAHDSRYEYDLNRPPRECIYNEAWGKPVWKNKLSEVEKKWSLKKHNNFYLIVETLVRKIEEKFKGCLIFDIHSFNYKRRSEKEIPLFNIGTEHVDQKRFQIVIDKWRSELSKIKLPHIKNSTEINKVFWGRGYFLDYVTRKFKNTLVLATEIKKVYCDEQTGDEFPEIVSSLRARLKTRTINTALYFSKRCTSHKAQVKYHLLSSKVDAHLKRIDNDLFNFLKKMEFLEYVNPSNLESEKQKFFRSHFKKEPVFKYKHLPVDPKELKKELYQIPTQLIGDIHIQNLYKSIIEAQVDQIDLLSLRATDKFLYASLKYFGEPSKTDILNAKYLLYLPDETRTRNDILLNATEAKTYFNQELRTYGFNVKVECVRNLVSKVAFFPLRKVLKIHQNAFFEKTHLMGLLNHEVGIHVLTTFNALEQPLKVLRFGFPLNTFTQEGLAILAEYLSGHLTTKRLKQISLRVVAIQHMIKTRSFNETFQLLTETYNLEPEKAYYMTVRIYRSGGLTKDYLYLKGFKTVLDAYQNNTSSLNNLLIGKTSIQYGTLLDELVERGIFLKPSHLPYCFRKPAPKNTTLNYILKGLKSECLNA